LLPAEISLQEDIYYVQLHPENWILNPSVMELISDRETGQYEALADALPAPPFRFDDMALIEDTIHRFYPKADTQSLSMFPATFDKKAVLSYIKAQQDKDFVIAMPAAGFCLLDKPGSSRGVLQEIEQLTSTSDFSDPLRALLNPDSIAGSKGPVNKGLHVPALLSATQQNILREVQQAPLQVVIGPPGTGKSYTIAALAAELISQERSVLIVSKNEEAVHVVADKIESDLGLQRIVVRANRKDYKKQLQKRVEQYLAGIGLPSGKRDEVLKLDKQQIQLATHITRLGKKIQHQLQLLEKYGTTLTKPAPNWMRSVQTSWIQWKLQRDVPIWKEVWILEDLTRRHHELLRAYLYKHFYLQLKNNLRYQRSTLVDLVQALKARSGNQKEAIFEQMQFRNVVKALPIWTVNLADLYRVLPLEKELFDVLVIDEASQCDLASVLPALQRAKHALIVGDPHQLRHISFLSGGQQANFAKRFQLSKKQEALFNYRSNSVLDTVLQSLQSQSLVHFLDEHFRSMPDLIAFSNQEFYSNRLRVMTSNPNRANQKHLFVNTIYGKRRASGYNTEEGEAILKAVQIVMDKEAALEPSQCQSIGLLSPLRDQVDWLRKEVEKRFTAEELLRHRIQVGTPFAFQGEERDLMYISFALDSTSHPSAFTYLNRPDVFNVSITRARSEQYLYVSFKPDHLSRDSLLYRYLLHANSVSREHSSNTLQSYESSFQDEVVYLVEELGAEKILYSYAAAGVEVDLVVILGGRIRGIDLVGFPGKNSAPIHLESWRMLHRAQLPVFYLPLSAWLLQPEETRQALKQFLVSTEHAAQSNFR
jgi:hypothetical protein